MTLLRAAFLAALLALIGVPLLLRPASAKALPGSETVIVITPHNEQIRTEFGRGFASWHQGKFGTPAQVIWNTPGGTNDISRLLTSSWEAALTADRPVGGDADVLFGGGSFAFEELSKPLAVKVAGAERSASVLAPIDFTDAWLQEIYGENDIGGRRLYDPRKFWFGAALSGFGIVWNNDILARLGVRAPSTWADLADPRLRGWVAMVNPAQSSSIATAFEAILEREGWVEGWRILRRAAANARSYSASSTRVPIDVSQGEAACGICIDFYGRFQSQSLLEGDRAAGRSGPPRVGYIDPRGKTVIDADPVGVLRNPPHPVLARRFVEFVLSDQGQALWQLPVGAPMGPKQFELRRLPIRRSFIDAHLSQFVDKVDPYDIAQAPSRPNSSARSFVTPLFAGMAMDDSALLSAAWKRIVEHPAYPKGAAIVTAAEVSDPQLKRWLEWFDSMPQVPGPDRTYDLADPAILKTVSQGWIRPAEWWGKGLWPAEERGAEALRRLVRQFFAERYRAILDDPEALR